MAQWRRCTLKSAKNYLKLGNNYGIGLGLGLGIGLVFRVIDTQWHSGRKPPKTQ